jgi:hemolysin D
MEPTNKSFIADAPSAKRPADEATVIEFLPDADEIERRPLPRTARITLHTLGLALLCFIVWATVSEVDRVVVARGHLVTPLPNLVVQPLETSIIQSIDVRIGQVVKKGERLATLDPTFTDADQAQLQTRLRSLDVQVERLQAELSRNAPVGKVATDADGKLQAQLTEERQNNYRAQLSRMEETVARLRAALETNRRDQDLLTARVKSLREIESMQEKLVAQQFGARVNFLSAQEKRLEVERDMQMAKNREQEVKRELAAAEAEKAAFGTGWRQKTMEDLLSTTRERDALVEQLQKAEKRHKLVTLTAPSDAVVLSIAKLSQGSVAKEAEPMFTLVPIAAELEAEVQIDALDIGYVKLGDMARMKFDAFPFQQHGTLPATVRTMSEDAFRRDSAANPAPLDPGMDSFYISRIKLGNGRLKNVSDKTRLLPGMAVSAEIVVGKRTVISYLLWPLTKALDESIREP